MCSVHKECGILTTHTGTATLALGEVSPPDAWGGGDLATELLVSGGCCHPTLVTEPLSCCQSTARVPRYQAGAVPG